MELFERQVPEAEKIERRIQRLLGVKDGNGKALGLDEKWAYNIIKTVGNYGEVFDRNCGKDSPLKLDRGLSSRLKSMLFSSQSTACRSSNSSKASCRASERSFSEVCCRWFPPPSGC